jgi:hypothetical protein
MKAKLNNKFLSLSELVLSTTMRHSDILTIKLLEQMDVEKAVK